MIVLAVLLGLMLLTVVFVTLEIVASRGDLKRCPPPGRMITINGVQLHLVSKGQGRPTVVLDAGLGDSGLVWADVQTRLARSTRVCSYDRAGLGWSEPAPGPRDGERMAVELMDLLQAAGESGPYLLVGHSSGCHQVRLFAARYPEHVAGLVLIDPPVFLEFSNGMAASVGLVRRSLSLIARLGAIRRLGRAGRLDLLFGGASPPVKLSHCAGFLYRPQALSASLAETAALPVTIRQVNATATPGAWRDWPVLIFSANKGKPQYQAVHRSHAELAKLSSHGEHILIGGSHFVHFQYPDLVADSIARLIRRLREQEL